MVNFENLFPGLNEMANRWAKEIDAECREKVEKLMADEKEKGERANEKRND